MKWLYPAVEWCWWQGPFSPLPWVDEMFDKILLVNVAYFFDSGDRDISEAYRVLRPGGRIVLYVTSRDTMQKWPFAAADTHWIFDAQRPRQSS